MFNLNMTWRALGAAVIALLFTTAVSAQQPARIRGQIEKADGSTLSLKMRDGSMLDVKVADDARVAALVKASLADRGRTEASRRFRFTSSYPRSAASSPIATSVGMQSPEAR